jgi:hypothetical protein
MIQSISRCLVCRAASLFLLAIGVQASFAASVSIHQVSWFNGITGATTIPDSAWGQAVIDVTPGTETQFVNVVARNSGEWLVANAPVLSAQDDPDPGPVAVNVDLGAFGISEGQSASGSPFDYKIGLFEETVPTGSFAGSGTVSTSRVTYDLGFDFLDLGDDLNSPQDPSGITSLIDPILFHPGAPPAANTAQTKPDPNAKVVRVKRKMSAAEQGVNECAPGSAANSIHWLSETQGLDVGGKTLQQIHQELVEKMKTDPKTGTSVKNFLDGKNEVYGSKLSLKSVIGKDKVTWEWIEKEIDAGADVELFYAWWGKVQDKDKDGAVKEKWQWNGHAVTVQGKYDDGKNRKLWVRDDWNQGVNGGTDLPRLTDVGSQYDGYLSLLNESKSTYVYFAHSESIPEPPMLALMLIGVAVSVIAGRPRPRRAQFVKSP